MLHQLTRELLKLQVLAAAKYGRINIDSEIHANIIAKSPAFLPTTPPVSRFRVGKIRINYDVTEKAAEVLAIIPKSMATDWLEEAGGKS
jgi:hypothetical protein